MVEEQDILINPGVPYCRLCLSTLGSNTFKQLSSSLTSTETIAEAIEAFARVKILEEDDYSKLICFGCYIKLNASHRFKALIEESDDKLKNYLNTKDPLETNNQLVVNESIGNHQTEINIKVEVEDTDYVPENPVIEHIKVESLVEQDQNLNEESQEGVVEKKKRYFCSICNRGFAKKTTQEVHEFAHKYEGSYPCEKCGRQFKNALTLWSHKRIHSNLPAYKCDQCDKTFKTRTLLKLHIISHSEFNKLFKCKTCQKSFQTIGQRDYHRQTRHKERSTTECHICGKFIMKIAEHLKAHTKPYKCHYCSQSFGYRGLLNAHLNNHTKELTFKCEFCDKVYGSAKSLKWHLKSHNETCLYQCEFCDKKFNYKEGLERHLQREHPEQNIC